MSEGQKSSRGRLLNRIALAAVVALTAWAAIQSSISSSRSNEALETVQRVTLCNTNILGTALTVLNSRSAYSKAQADANLGLQKAQAALLLPSIQGKIPTPEESAAALKRYFDSLTQFVKAAEAAKDTAEEEEYPNQDDIANVLLGMGLSRPLRYQLIRSNP